MKKNIIIFALVLNTIGLAHDKYKLKKIIKEKEELIEKQNRDVQSSGALLKISVALTEYWKTRSNIYEKMCEYGEERD